MYINELYIEQFGAIKNQRIILDSKFNLIVGENESGKSTVCAFIKFMLYGFSDTKEKERHTPLDTGIASGSMLVSCDDKKYRIQRKNNKNVTVFDEDSAREITEWKNSFTTPGEFLLGIPASLYTRAIYVSQTAGARLDGDTAGAISNLLLTGDEAINLKKAKKILEDSRKALKLKKGTGGKISELENEINDLSIKLSNAISAKEATEIYYAELYDENEKIEALQKRLSKAKSADDYSRLLQIRKKLDEQELIQAEIQKNGILLNALILDNTYNGFLPDSTYEARLHSLDNEIKLYSDELQDRKNKLNEILGSKNEPPEYQSYCALGKKEKILQKFKMLQTATKLSNTVFHTCALVFILSMIAIIASQVSEFFGNSRAFVFIALGVSASFGMAGFFCKIIFGKQLRELIKALKATDTRQVDYICNECESYELSKGNDDYSLLTEMIGQTSEKLEQRRKELQNLLESWNKKDITRALEDYAFFTGKHKQLSDEYNRAKNDLSATNLFLSAFSSDDIALARAIDPISLSEEPSGENIEELQALLDRSIDRRGELNVLIAKNDTSPSGIEELLEKIEQKTAQKEEYILKHDALEMTIEALETAENTIRSTVSPYLSSEATIRFDSITGGQYSALRLDSEMNLSYVSANSDTVTPSQYLSMGSSELAWLCLRLALHKKLSPDFSIPIILDETLVFFDDTRLRLILNELKQIANDGTQVLLFSASSRESAALKGEVNVINLTSKR